MKKAGIVLFLLLIFIVNSYGATLEGIGYGATMDEAKEESLADLSSSIKVQVFSKHEQTTMKSNNKVVSDYTRWTKLSTNVPIISPSIYYSREKGKHKAIASIDKPQLYSDKLGELAEKIDEITKNVTAESDKALNYRALSSVQSLYDEYESYQVVADVLGVDYKKPRISSAQSLTMLLELQETPPSLEVAAEILTKDMTEKNIYVVPVLYAGQETVTDFGSFFKDMLAVKVNSVEVEEDGSHKLRCTYSLSAGDIVMACSLRTGVSKVIKSSAVKIPQELVNSMVTVPKTDTTSILNNFEVPKTDYKIWLKISTDGDPVFLRENEPFSLLVKTNKAGYIYFVTVNNGKDGQANVLLLDWNNTFIKHISENQVNKWVSIGQFRVKSPFGSESLYAFGLEKKPQEEYILPEYTHGKIGYLKNVRSDIFLQDILSLFKRQQGDKTMTSITYSTAPNRKKVGK